MWSPRDPARRCSGLRRGERAAQGPAQPASAHLSLRPLPRSGSPWSRPEQGAEEWDPRLELHPRWDSAHRTRRSLAAATAAQPLRWPLEGRPRPASASGALSAGGSASLGSLEGSTVSSSCLRLVSVIWLWLRSATAQSVADACALETNSGGGGVVAPVSFEQLG